RVLFRVWPNRGSVVGVRVVKIALLLLTIHYAHYAPLFAASAGGLLPAGMTYLRYAPLYDLMVFVLLAFGMIMMTMGEVQHDLETANERLAQARDRVEAMARLDHLTSALNRHAFYSMVGESRAAGRAFTGCVAVADVDNLKIINDLFGHSAGD